MQNQQKSVKPYIVVGNREQMTHQEWLNIRKNSIGGSEVSQAVGMNRFRAPLGLWAEKTGVITKQVEQTAAMEWGNILEPVVKQHFAKVTGFVVKDVPQIFASAKFPFLTANLDGVCIDSDGEPCVLEIKTSSYGSDWEENGCPIEYFLQTQWYMYITGMKIAYLAVLIGGADFRYIKIDRNDEIINVIVAKAVDFWQNNVLKRVPPEPTAADNDIMAKIFPKSSDNIIVLEESYAAMLDQLEDVKQKEAVIKSQRDEIEAKLKAMLGNYGADTATCKDWKISWKETSRTTFDSAKAKSMLTDEQVAECSSTSTSRTLRVSKTGSKATKKK